LETGVSDTESFIEEVTEEVRRDRLFATFRKYGWIAVVLVAGIVGGAAYTEWSKATHASEAKAFGDSLLTALDENSPDARRKALADTASAADGNQDRLAIQKLMLASDVVGDKAGSLAALEAIATDAAVPQIYRDLAVLRRVILAGTDMDVSTRRAALDPLTASGRPFRTLALEQLAYLSVEAGEPEAAITQLRALSTDQEAPTGLRQRAGQMIEALGGKTEKS
jgi:hypothetical protein